MGRKKILIGSIFVLALILLMPSIPAIQQSTLKEELKQDIMEKIETLTFEDIKEIKTLDSVKFPLLMWLVIILPTFRFFRGAVLFGLSLETEDSGWHGFRYITGIKPLLFLWSMVTLIPCALWWNFWMTISDKLGWGWSFY